MKRFLLGQLFFCFAAHAWAAGLVVQDIPQTRNTGGGSTTWSSATPGSAMAIGDYIEAYITWGDTVTTNPTSVIDSASQNYTLRVSFHDTTQGQYVALYTFPNNASHTALVVTATWATGPVSQAIWVKEISGVNGIISFTGQTLATPGTGNGAISTGTLTNGSSVQPNFASSLFCLLHGSTGAGHIVPFAPSGVVTGVTGWAGSGAVAALSASVNTSTGTPYPMTATDATYGASETYDSLGVLYSVSVTAAGNGTVMTLGVGH